MNRFSVLIILIPQILKNSSQTINLFLKDYYFQQKMQKCRIFFEYEGTIKFKKPENVAVILLWLLIWKKKKKQKKSVEEYKSGNMRVEGFQSLVLQVILPLGPEFCSVGIL